MTTFMSDDKYWAPTEVRIRDIKQFAFTARVAKKGPLEQFGANGHMFYMLLEDPKGAKEDQDLIKCKVWNAPAKAYYNLLEVGKKYRFEALLTHQTKRQEWGLESKHPCELSFSKETLVHSAE